MISRLSVSQSVRIRYLAKWTVSIALIIVALRTVDIDSVFQSIQAVNLHQYIIIIVTAWCIQLATTAKWRLLNPTIDFRQLLRTNVVSQFYAFLIPSSLTGDVARVFKLEAAKHNRDLHATVVIVDRLTGLLATIVIMAVVSPSYAHRYEIMGQLIGVISPISLILMTTLVLGYSLPLGRMMRHRIIKLVRRQERLPRFLTRMAYLVGMSGQFMKPHLMIKSVLAGIGVHLLNAAYQYLLFSAFAVHVSVVDCIVVSAISQLASTIPIGIAGIGPRDLSIVGFATALGAKPSNVVASLFAGYPVILMIVFVGLWLDAKADAQKPL